MAKANRVQKVHQYAIADHLGVSRSTVSKVFSNRKDVSDEMRLRVIRAANEMGYEYGPLPAATDENEFPRIGIMVRLGPETPAGYRADYLESLSSYAIDAQVALTAHFIPSHVPAEELFESSGAQPASLRDGNLDGVLLAGPWSEDALILASSALPCAALAYGAQHGCVDTTEPDTTGAARQIVEHLLALGHRRLAFVGFSPEIYWSMERYAGFLVACTSGGIDKPERFSIRVAPGLLWDPEVVGAWSPIVDKATHFVRSAGVTALVCSSDWTAYHLYAGLRDRELCIPEDVSITGFDDLEILTWGCPKITSIHVPRRTLARAAVARLLRRIADPTLPVRRALYSCEFVDHGTTAAPRL